MRDELSPRPNESVDHSGNCLRQASLNETTISEWFDRFKSVYPKRRGANPTMPAMKSFAKAVKKGADPGAIIAGARLYAAEQLDLRKVGTEYICQMATWLNQGRWLDYQPSAAPTTELVWIAMDDPRWRAMAGRYYEDRGMLPPHVPGLGGQGWRFPSKWLEEKGRGGFDHRSPAGSVKTHIDNGSYKPPLMDGQDVSPMGDHGLGPVRRSTSAGNQISAGKRDP